MQGWRISQYPSVYCRKCGAGIGAVADQAGMEDSHTVHLYLPPADAGYVAKHPADNIKQQPAGCTVSNDDEDDEGPALFGVFDGHGGSSAAKFAGTTMHSRLRALDSYSEFKKNGKRSGADQNRGWRLQGCAEGGVLEDGRRPESRYVLSRPLVRSLADCQTPTSSTTLQDAQLLLVSSPMANSHA